VFTDEIINGLYRILDAIKNNKPYDHVGIWIDGYYGSGKSHFLKYLDYCITPRTQEKALERLLEAVKAIGQTGGYVYIMENNSLPYISTTLSTDVTAQVKAKLGLK
jgi:hypothetical protein